MRTTISEKKIEAVKITEKIEFNNYSILFTPENGVFILFRVVLCQQMFATSQWDLSCKPCLWFGPKLMIVVGELELAGS